MMVSLVRWCILAICMRFCGARHLTQAPAPAPTSDSRYLATLRSALDGDKLESGPILYKTFEAAYYSLLAQEGQLAPNGSQIVQYGDDSRLLVSWDNSSLALNLAFHTSPQDNSSLTSSVSSLAPWSNFSDIFEGSPPSVNPTALQLFDSAISNATSSSGAISAVTGSRGVVGRVSCSGWSGGAALAQLCGPWAQLYYPAAQVRVITFGAPRVGDEKFGYTLEQFVDLPYLWITESDNRTVGNTPQGPLKLPYVTRVVSEANYSGAGEQNSIQYYSTLLNNTFKGQTGSVPVVLQSNFSHGYKPRGRDSQFVLSLAPENGGFFDRVQEIAVYWPTTASTCISDEGSGTTGTVADSLSAAGSAISNVLGNLFGGNDAPAPAPSASDISGLASPGSQGTASGSGTVSKAGHDGCTPILCKIQPALIQACASYNDGASLGAGSITVSAEIGTDVALLWSPQNKTATFAWRGTEDRTDWSANLRLQFSNDVSSEYFSELYNGSEIYKGELESFRAVTDQANTKNYASVQSSAQNITARILELSGGVEPIQIRCIGHSLGGGLATICGPWAAEAWPAADVRVVTFGSPKAGNIEFAASVYATVGRTYRVVHRNDAVPSLPPFNKYLHSNFAIYLPGSDAVLDDRPPTEISDLTWDDHGCDDQYGGALQDVTNVTIPIWAQQMSASA